MTDGNPMGMKANSPPELDLHETRRRQQRVLLALSAHGIDRLVVTSHDHVQYLTGYRPHRLLHAAACLDAKGQCTLVAPQGQPNEGAVDRWIPYEPQWRSTLRQDQIADALECLKREVGLEGRGKLGIERTQAAVALVLGDHDSRLVDVEPLLWQIRRFKHADELLMMQHAIRSTGAMYARAREVLRPGMSELEMYSELHSAAVASLGEPPLTLGNDFQSNSPGGPPRPRPVEAGELLILDLGPSYRGYHADNCRTLAVGGQPSETQLQAWRAVVAVLEMVEQTVKPGVSCRGLFQEAQRMLDEYRPDAFFHHLGHGFGLYPHEAPHLNPHWDDYFEEGDCFTAEPGVYHETLRAGIRLEQNYRVTADGVERLTDFPLELT